MRANQAPLLFAQLQKDQSYFNGVKVCWLFCWHPRPRRSLTHASCQILWSKAVDPKENATAHMSKVLSHTLSEYSQLGVCATHGGDWELVLNELERALTTPLASM
jgi:hypothetical protein